MIEDVIKHGGQIKVDKQGLLNVTYYFLLGEEKNAELVWEKEIFDEQAFYTTADTRFEITSRGMWGRTIHVTTGGHEVLEMKPHWAGRKGEIITRQAHRYTFKKKGIFRSKTTVKREVGSQPIFTVPDGSLGGDRLVSVYPSTLDRDEFHALLAVVVFHRISEEKRAAAAAAAGS
jgi:hypothetical protein